MVAPDFFEHEWSVINGNEDSVTKVVMLKVCIVTFAIPGKRLFQLDL